jgi:hypothetical protein
MLNLSRVIKPWKEADALNAHINLYGFWTETAFLTKSGDLGMVLSVAGVDYASRPGANPSQTTSPPSHSSPQPSCDRFVRLHWGSHQEDFSTAGQGRKRVSYSRTPQPWTEISCCTLISSLCCALRPYRQVIGKIKTG